MNFEPVVSGVYLEGLCADAESVWVADPIAGGLRRAWLDGRVEAWLPDKKWVGGLLRGPGETVLISGADEILWFDAATGRSGTLIDSVGGAPLPGANEMVADAGGALYFGGNDIASIAAGRDTQPVSLYRRDPDGSARALVSGLRFTNGVGFSPDGKRFYCNETFVGPLAFDVLPDGGLANATRLLDKFDCDGMVVDSSGVIWITGFETAALVRIAPDGSLLDPVPVPGGGATNVRFGGPDLREMFVTSVAEGAAMKLKAGIWPTVEDSFVYRTRSDVAGQEPVRAAFTLPHE